MTPSDDRLSSLVEEARGETTLHGLGLTDSRSMEERIWADFTKEAASWARLVYVQEVNPRRVIERLEDRDHRVDFLIVANPARLDQRGLIQPFPQPYRSMYPKGWTDSGCRWLPLYVQPTVVVFNRHHVALPPTEWQEFGEDRWKDAAVFDAPWRMMTSGPALAELRATLGDDPWKRLLDRLSALAPQIVADNERAVSEVATGRRRIGLSIWNVARRIRPGSPVGHAFLDPTPCIPGFAVMSAAASRSALARLFLAWLGSPGGQQAYARTGRVPALPQVDAPTALSRVLPSHVRALYGSVDWLGDPESFTRLFLELFPEPADGLAEGKLR